MLPIYATIFYKRTRSNIKVEYYATFKFWLASFSRTSPASTYASLMTSKKAKEIQRGGSEVVVAN